MSATLNRNMTQLTNTEIHILIVEDEKALADSLKDTITAMGYQVSIAGDGEEGLTAALGSHPDALVVDLLMPKMSGMDLLTALRKDPWGKDVPVIILTNLSADSKELVQEIVDVKPTYFLVKSDWALKDIAKKVNSIFEELNGGT